MTGSVVELIRRSLLARVLPAGEASTQGSWLIETVIIIVPTSPEPTGSGAIAQGGRFVIKIGRSSCLFGGDPAQPNTFVGKENSCPCQKKLSELKNGIQSPALEEKDASAQQADGSEEDVVIPRQRWFEGAHEIKHGTTDSKDDADDAGPVETGVDQVALSRGP